MLTATAVSAQQPSSSAETTPAAAPPADAPTPTPAATPTPADSSNVDLDLDALLATQSEDVAPASAPAPAETTAAAAPQASPASDTPAAATSASPTSPTENAAVSAGAESPSTPPSDAAAAAPDSDASYALIPVAFKKDEPETGAQAIRKAPTQLEEIVVTATKRPELVRDIPASISVLTGQKLEELGAHELKDFIQSVPGINTQDEIAGVQKKLSVRGVGPDTGTNQTVGIVYGDVPLSDPYGSYTIADPDPWDLSTVEVLKGPQGTLFGATSLAGIIRYVPNNPVLGEWGGRVSADWVRVTDGGTEPSFGAVLNVPIGETMAVRFAGSWQHKPGLVDINNPSYKAKDADDGYTRTGRIMALWQPTEDLAINAWYIKGQRSADEAGYVTNSDGKFTRDDSPAPSLVNNGYSLANLDVRYNFDWATLVSISGYQTKHAFNDADASYIVTALAQAGIRSIHAWKKVDTSGYLQELRLVSPGDGPWTWLGGAFYSSYKADIDSTLYVYPGLPVIATVLNLLPSQLLGPTVDPLGIVAVTTGFHPVDASEKALFGEVSRKVGDDWKFTLGGRLYQAGVSGTSVKGGLTNPTPKIQKVESIGKGFSPKFAATWQVTDDILSYATVSRGFQYGGFNIGTVNDIPATFKSSTLWNNELGVRTDWMDSTLRVDLTGIYVIWKNPQVYQTKGQTDGYTDNVGGARSMGAETTLSYLTPIEGLKLETAASYIVAKTSEAFTDSSGNIIPVGTVLPSSPKFQASTTLSYAYGIGEWQTQTALQHTYQGTAFNNIVHATTVGGYSLLNLNFSVSRSDLEFAPSVSLSVNNLMNTNALTSALGGSDTLPKELQLTGADITSRPYVYTLPRSFRLNFSAKF
ncbi:MAG: TonB-dependent receptor [Pseudomonadota bacterium]